jgi:hypothetical protein
LLALLFAGMNALIFEFSTRQTISAWEADLIPPPQVRLNGGAGIIIIPAVLV